MLLVRSGKLAVFLLLGGCGETNPVRDVFVAVGAGPPTVQVPAFVQESRPAELSYIPIGRAVAGAAVKSRTPEEIKALEAELEAERARHQAVGEAAREEGQATSLRP